MPLVRVRFQHLDNAFAQHRCTNEQCFDAEMTLVPREGDYVQFSESYFPSMCHVEKVIWVLTDSIPPDVVVQVSTVECE